jgi:hypothetical protein
MSKPVCIYDAAGWVIQAEVIRLIDRYLVSANVEGRDVELVPVHRCGYERLPYATGHGDIMNSWDNISQLVPCKR